MNSSESSPPERLGPEHFAAILKVVHSSFPEIEKQRGGQELKEQLLKEVLPHLLKGLKTGSFLALSKGGLESSLAVAEIKESTLVLHYLWVSPLKRRQGLASSLLGELTAWATSWGLTGIEGPALPGSRPVKNLYEKFGFKARLLTMSRKL